MTSNGLPHPRTAGNISTKLPEGFHASARLARLYHLTLSLMVVHYPGKSHFSTTLFPSLHSSLIESQSKLSKGEVGAFVFRLLKNTHRLLWEKVPGHLLLLGVLRKRKRTPIKANFGVHLLPISSTLIHLSWLLVLPSFTSQALACSLRDHMDEDMSPSSIDPYTASLGLGWGEEVMTAFGCEEEGS